MRINTLRQTLSLLGLIIAAAWTGLVSSPADPVGNAGTVDEANSHSLVMAGNNADDDWAQLESACRPPSSPAAWLANPPTTAEKEKFYLPFIQKAAADAKDYYTKFPGDNRAVKAKVIEFRFLLLQVTWGLTNQEAHLEAVEKSLLNNPALPEENRLGMLRDVAQSSPPDKTRPLLQEIANGNASAKMKSAAAGYLEKMNALGHPVDLKFTAVDGRSVDLAKLKGKVVLVDFWATWCGPCVGEVPNVKKTYDELHGNGFEIVGISLDKEKDALTQFTADHKMEWPQFFDGQYWQNKYARQFGIESIPTMWLIDKKGNLRDMDAREHLSGEVQKLLAE